MSPASAEVIKILLNYFMTTNIAYANMITDIADQTPGNWGVVSSDQLPSTRAQPPVIGDETHKKEGADMECAEHQASED
jgi:hypothetical protein